MEMEMEMVDRRFQMKTHLLFYASINLESVLGGLTDNTTT